MFVAAKTFHELKECLNLISQVKNRLQIPLLTLSEFKQISSVPFPLKSSENHKFSDDFKGKRGKLIPLNSLNIRGKIWGQSLMLNKGQC